MSNPDLQEEKAEAEPAGKSPDETDPEDAAEEEGVDEEEELQEETLSSDYASNPGVVRSGRRGGSRGRSMDTELMDRLRAEGAIDHALETLYGGYAVGDEIIYVEHRGKGVVVRERVTSERGPYGIWNEIAALHGPYLIPHFFYDGYSAVWADARHKIYLSNPSTTTSHRNSYSSSSSHTPAPSFVGGFSGGWSGGGGGGYRGGHHSNTTVANAVTLLNPGVDIPLVVRAGSKLTGKWKLDLTRDVEVDFSTATAPVDLEYGSLEIASGEGLTINLTGIWDGVSTGVFDLVDLGIGSALTIDGATVVEGRDYLPALGPVAVRYKDVDGNENTTNLADDSKGLDYSLLVQDGTLSLVVSGTAGSGASARVGKPRKVSSAALPMGGAAVSVQSVTKSLSAAPATGLVLSSAGEGDGQASSITWTEESPFASGEDAIFTDNGDATTDTLNVTLGGNVTAGVLTVSGTDNYNFTLGDCSINATEFTKTGPGSLTMDVGNDGTGALNVDSIAITGGSVATNAAINASSGITVAGDAENSASFTTTGAVTTPSIRVDGASMSVNQAVTGLQSLTLANGATMNNAGSSAIIFQPGTTLGVEGAVHSTLMGDWTIDASKAFVLDFSAEYTSSINIASGTLTITGTRSATNVDNALILNLGAKWDGTGDFSREIISVGSAGRIVVDGAETASGDQISHFSHLYLRYSDQTGTIHTIDLSGAGNETSADLNYALDWSGTSLTFSVVHTKEEAQTPFVWQHGYGNLTWKENGTWRGNTYTSTGSNNVLFKSDGDTTKDTVAVTINGTVAPGDIGDGVAGIRVMGDDNFTFQGTNNASIANYTKEVDGEQVTIATTLSKTGSGTLTIKDNVSLDYTGRTEVLGGTMIVQYHNTNTEGTVHRWTPTGTVVVGINGTLQVGSGKTSLQDDVIWLGDSLFENDGVVKTNILKTTGTDIAGRGRWETSFMLLEQTNFEAGSVKIKDDSNVLKNAGTNGSMVLNGSEGTVYGKVEAQGQNITIMNRGGLTVHGEGVAYNGAAVTTKSLILAGRNTYLDILNGQLSSETVHLSSGAALTVAGDLKHSGTDLTLTLSNGVSVENVGPKSAVLNASGNTNIIVQMEDAPNYLIGDWTINLNTPLQLDFSYFTNATMGAPIVQMNGTLKLMNAGSSQLGIRADGITYDTMELFGVGDRGKICLQRDDTPLKNGTDYLKNLKHLYYTFFFEDENGTTANINNAGVPVMGEWRTIDLITKTKVIVPDGKEYKISNFQAAAWGTGEDFSSYTGLSENTAFHLLFENNTLSLIISPEHPTSTIGYYHWLGDNQNLWTRNNSAVNSPWSENDIYLDGHRVVFGDVDAKGVCVTNYSVELDSHVATGHLGDGGTAGIEFSNRGPSIYIIKSDDYHGTGYIADLSATDLTTVLIEGGRAAFRTRNTYGGALSSEKGNPTTIIKAAMVGKDLEYFSGTKDLSAMDKQQALDEDMVSVARYVYGYRDSDGSLHAITQEEYNAGTFYDKHPEEIAIIQTNEGDWYAAGATFMFRSNPTEMTAAQSADDSGYVSVTPAVHYGYVQTKNGVTKFVTEGVFRSDLTNSRRVELTLNGDGKWSYEGMVLNMTDAEAQENFYMTVQEETRTAYAYRRLDDSLAFVTKADYENHLLYSNARNAQMDADGNVVLEDGNTYNVYTALGITAEQAVAQGYAVDNYYQGNDYTYAYYYIGEDNQPHFITLSQFQAGHASEVQLTWNGEAWEASVSTDVLKLTEAQKAAIGDKLITPRGNYYTYVAHVEGSTECQFLTEAEFDQALKDKAAGTAWDGYHVARAYVTESGEGWYISGPDFGKYVSRADVAADDHLIIYEGALSGNYFGYGVYTVDESGNSTLHFVTQDEYISNRYSTADDTHQAIIIRLNHNEQEGWYTPGELLAEDSYALGTSEVEIGFGGTLLATKDLHLISVDLKSGARLETYGNLYIGKEFDVTSGARVTIGGLLDAADVQIKTGGMLTSHDVTSRKIVVENGAVWHMNDDRTSTIDVSDYVELHGGSRITGVALITNGDLLLQPESDNSNAVLDGTIKIGTNASLNLSHLQPENANGHFRSNLYITDRGGLLLEPHDGIVLTPSEVNHLLDDHGTTPHAEHYMHLATMEEGARFGIESSAGDITILNPALARSNDPTYASSVQVFLASGLGYMVDATVSMRPTAEEGLNEVVLHLTNKANAPKYVWDGTYDGNWNNSANDNIWTMGQGSAWSDGVVFDATAGADQGRSAVYFLETARTTTGENISYHYVNPDGTGVFNRAKYVNVQGDVWCDSITVDVDRLYDMTLDQYRFNLGYLFYSVDMATGKQGDGAITDYYVHKTDGTAISSKAYDLLSAEEKAAYGERQQTSITKNGTGVLTLASDNDFSGDVNLNSGTIFITSETGLGTSHVFMNDGTSLNVNYIFENRGSSHYRNPYLYNEITINDGVPLGDDELGHIGGGKGSNVTIGYNPVSVLDFMKSTGMQGLPTDKDAITSRHWRTLTIMGALHGGEQTTLTLQGYTSSDSRELWVSMFHICGSEDETDFSGTIKLANYRNTSPAAYNFGTQEDLQNDTNTRRGTGPVQLTISDATLRYARLDLTREDVLASYTKDDGSKGYGRRQTPTNTLLMEGSASLAGLDADFIGTVATDPEHGAVTVATQGEELTSVRTIATGDYTLALVGSPHDAAGAPDKTYVYSGVLGGNYAYATPGDGTFKKGYEDKEDTRRSQGRISLVHTGDGAQYIHTAYLQDLSIGNEKGGAYAEASGGTVGFHYLDLQGNLSMYSGARLELGVNDAVRTSDAHNGAEGTAVHWDNSAFVSDNVTLQENSRAIIHTTLARTANIPVSAPVGSGQNGESGFTTNWVMADKEVPLGSVIDGSLTVNHGSHLDFNSAIMPVKLAGYDTAEKATWLTQLQFPVVEKDGQSDYSILCAPETGYLLDITGELVLKGQVHVDFKGVDFSAEDNGSTYFLARAQQGIVGSVTEQTISLGNGYYGVVRGLQTYTTDVTSISLLTPGSETPTTLTAVTVGTEPEPGVTGLAALADIQVTVKPAVGSTDYYLEYTWTDRNNVVHEDVVTLVQASNNVYSYTIGDNSYDAVLTTNLSDNSKMARMNLSDLAFRPEEGYIIMTVTNTPPRVWFNTNNVMTPVDSVIARDLKGNPLYMDDDRPVFMTPEGIYFTVDPNPPPEDSSIHSTTIVRNEHEYVVEHFGATDNDNVWHADGPVRKGWIDNHEDFWVGCRVTFNKYGSTHYLGNDTFTRGTQTFTLNAATGEYGETVDGVWHPYVSMMYDEQFDLVEIDGTVQPRSIFVDCGEAIIGNEGNHLVKTRSHNVNYWMRDCTVEGSKPGCISDITVTEENIGKLGAAVYNEKIGTIIAGTLEKTGGGYLRISTHNTYTGGTWLKEGFLIIDCADALGSPDAGATDRLNGAGDGALHAHGGTTLMLNYIDEQKWSIFRNDIRITMPESNVGEKTAVALRDGFMVTNGIGLGEDGTVNAHFVDLNGAITAETGRRAVMTLSALIVPENGIGFRDYTSYTVTNLEGYNGILRLDSHFASPVEGTVDGMYENTETNEFVALRASQTYELADGTVLTDGQKAQMDCYYDSTKRQVVYTYNGQRVTIKSHYVHLDGSDAPEANNGEVDVKTGGEIELRITGSSLGKTEVDLSLNSAYHNAMVLDMRDPSGMTGTTSVYTLGGVCGLSGGTITRDAAGALQGYNSNVVSAKGVTGEDAYAVLHLNLNEADRVYSGMVGYGYFHSAAADTLGQIYASAPLAMVKEGPRTQTIFSGRLNGLEIKSGALHFAKDLILCGDFKTADGTQLIIGTTNLNNLPFCGSSQYSVVIQGDGVWAIGSEHTSKYTTDETDVSTIYKWDEFTTAVGKYNAESDLKNVYASSGTLTAVSDYALHLSVQFDVAYGKHFTVDTSHYNYDTEILASEGITKEEVSVPHTISFDQVLAGRGKVVLTGGGTVQLQAANEFDSEEDALLVVEKDTTLRLQHDNALATLKAGGGYEFASTVNVTGEGSRTILAYSEDESRDEAYLAGMRFANDGCFIVEDGARDTQATISLRPSLSREAAPGPALAGADSSKIAGDPATLNVQDVHVTAHADGVTRLEGIGSTGNIRNNAQVTIEDSADGMDAYVSGLTLGTCMGKTTPEGVGTDQSLIKLKEQASTKLSDVLIAADAQVWGSTDGTTGIMAAKDVADRELVTLEATRVEAETGRNLSPGDSLVYTGGKTGVYQFNNSSYSYSGSAITDDSKQVLFQLANFGDCVITGTEGGLTLLLSDADYTALVTNIALAENQGLLGIYMHGVAVQEGTAESLLRLQSASGQSILSEFYVSANSPEAAGINYGSVFYFGTPMDVPEPATATLSLLALAALAARRRRTACSLDGRAETCHGRP